MSRITKPDFVRTFQDKSFDLSKVDDSMRDQLWSAGTSQWGLSRVDSDRNGKIEGDTEIKALFDFADKFDRNGSTDSLQTHTGGGRITSSGKVLNVLNLLAEQRAGAPVANPTPVRPEGPSSTVDTSGSTWDEVTMGQKLLRLGSSGPAVQHVQQALTMLGYEPGSMGTFDLKTKQAVLQFQRDQRLSADGVVGPGFSSSLDLASVRGGFKELTHGYRGDAVKEMQKLLSRAGFGVQDTGIFGDQTKSQLEAFQRANSLQASGSLGKTTLDSLERAAGASGPAPISARGKAQMQEMLNHAKRNSAGRFPDGYCYTHVANFIDRVGYGDIAPWGFNANIPSAYHPEARQFAEYLNQNGNAERMGLQKLNLDNPYDAPPGAIVVVRAGTPGTRHATAGDIAIKGEGNRFYNGGDMSYHGRHNFPPGNDLVLGIYVPK